MGEKGESLVGGKGGNSQEMTFWCSGDSRFILKRVSWSKSTIPVFVSVVLSDLNF